jgi:hypothetical protein
MPALRAGAQLTVPGLGDCTVVGFAIDEKGAPAVASRSAYDRSTEYAVLRTAAPESEIPHPLRALSPDVVTKDGPDYFDEVDAHPIGPEWQLRFDAMLRTRPGEPDLTPALLRRRLEDENATIVVVGGAVRDVLLGEPERQGDLDLAGTLLPQAFRRLVQELEGLPVGGNRELLTNPYRLPSAKRATVVKVVDTDIELALEYAPLLVDRWRSPWGEPTPLFGSSFAANSGWRDLSCNTLLYGLDKKKGWVLYDPTGDGLADIGLTPRRLLHTPDDTRRRDLRLCPVDIPEAMPDDMLIERIVRLLKLLPRFAEKDADLAQVGEWSRRHEARLQGAIVKKEPPVDQAADHPLTSALSNMLSDESIERIRARSADYENWLGADLWKLVHPLVPGQRAVRGHGNRRRPRLHDRTGAIAPLVRVAGQWEVDSERVEAPSDTTPRGWRRYLGNRLGGYRHTVVEVLWGDREIADVLALAPALGEGTWYVELDGAGRLIPVDEQELDKFRKEEQPGRT